MKLKDIFNKNIKSEEFITIVSGLPRSGTSMMMKILEAGGLDTVTDNIRKADEDNPKGYYELEKVKKIEQDSSWLKRCKGKAFKMVSMLLYHLPNDMRYKVIFLRRDMDEILASQRKMLIRLNRKNEINDEEEMKRLFNVHLNEIENWLKEQNNISTLFISYNDILKNPGINIKKINKLFNNKLNLLDMTNIVDTSLYRQRKGNIVESS